MTDMEFLELEIETLKERILLLEKRFDDAITDKFSLYPMTESQTKCLEAMRQNIKDTGKIQVRKIARKLNISPSLVSYTKIQFVKKGLIKEITNYE